MTQRQSNNQWSGGMAADPAPKISECKNPLEKFSPRFFMGSRRRPPHLPKGHTINAMYYSSLRLKDILKEKHRVKVTKGVLFLHDNTLAHRAQPRRNWPTRTWASNALITHPILRIWPRQTTTISLG
jgi:hypothetical protein